MSNLSCAVDADQPLRVEWTRIDLVTCRECLEHLSEHFEEMLSCLRKATGMPNNDRIYNPIVKTIHEIYGNDEQEAKESRRQVRKLINERLMETAQHVCHSSKNKSALQSIAEELLLLPELLSIDKINKQISFEELERFENFYGNDHAEFREHGRCVIQSSERGSSLMLRGRKLYNLNQVKNTFEISLQIEHFHSCISIGICSDNVRPNDMEQGSNAFPIDPSHSTREGDIFTLMIDVEEYNIYLWNNYRSKKNRNKEIHKRERTISRRRCPLPWRFFVQLTARDNHIRIVY